jgi:hypothetical protein
MTRRLKARTKSHFTSWRLRSWALSGNVLPLSKRGRRSEGPLELLATHICGVIVFAVATLGAPAGKSEAGAPTAGPRNTQCIANPAACGFPDASNTGVPAGITLKRHNGDLQMQANTEYEALDVRGCVRVAGSNSALRRSRVLADCQHMAIDVEAIGISNVVFEDIEIDLSGMGGRMNVRALSGSGFTARRIHWHGGADCLHFGSNVVIEDSFCELPKLPEAYPGDPHLDGFQSSGGSDVLIRHNTIRNPNNSTSVIINGTAPHIPPQFNVRIINNLMAGGGWTVYCNAHGQIPSATIEFRDNRISRSYFTFQGIKARGGYWGPMTDCKGVPGVETTVWDEDNTPVRPQ